MLTLNSLKKQLKSTGSAKQSDRNGNAPADGGEVEDWATTGRCAY